MNAHEVRLEFLTELSSHCIAEDVEVGVVNLSTPWLDASNDHVAITVEDLGNGMYRLSENSCGIVDSPYRDIVIPPLIRIWGLRYNEEYGIYIECTKDEIGRKLWHMSMVISDVSNITHAFNHYGGK